MSDIPLMEPAGGHLLKEITCLKVSYGDRDSPLTCKLLFYYYNKRLIVTDIEGRIIDRVELFLAPKEILDINFRRIDSVKKNTTAVGELTFDCGSAHDDIVPEIFLITIEDNEIVVSDLSKQEIGRIELDNISSSITKIKFFEKEYQKEQS